MIILPSSTVPFKRSVAKLIISDHNFLSPFSISITNLNSITSDCHRGTAGVGAGFLR